MVGTLAQAELESLLQEQTFGRLGCCAEGELYVVPISYVYDPQRKRLLGQTTYGKKIEMMRKNPSVCVEVDDVRSLTHWRSAIVWGRYEELEGHVAAEAMGMIIDRYGPMFDEAREGSRRGRQVTPPRLNHAAAVEIVYAVRIDHMTGRREE